MNPVVKSVLEKAKALLNKDTWHVGSSARTAKGYSCGAYDSEAVAFCAFGAIFKTVGRDDEALGFEAVKILDQVAESKIGVEIDHRAISYYNDNIAKDVSDIHALFDEGIKRCES
jgi:hypothetical protein